MSIVEVIHHDEVIYHKFDKPPDSPPKTPRYESALEKKLKSQVGKTAPSRRTMGYAVTPLPKPDKFLKKGEGILHPRKVSDHKCLLGDLPPVPKCPGPKKDKPRPVVNFKVKNIKKAIHTKPKTPEPKLIDTRDGHVKKLLNSGEIPQFSKRKDFGLLPEYLLKRQIRKKAKQEKAQAENDAKEDLCKLISKQEREKLLEDLKENWAQMQKNFLQLPMLTDTIPKIIKKTKLEEELKQLEKDIKLVESNPYIYVYEK